jgi:hypothetical protein
MGIAGICPGPNLSRRNAEHKVYPYLLRNVKAVRPNHVWGIDGRPFGRLVNISLDMAHCQGWVS